VITPKEYINGVLSKGRKTGPLYEEAKTDYRRWLREENSNWPIVYWANYWAFAAETSGSLWMDMEWLREENSN